MKILWFSDLPHTATGYGVQTRRMVPRLRDLGHDIAIASKFGLQGGLLSWSGCQLYPSGHMAYSQEVLAAHAQHFGADVIITLCDLWVCEPRRYQGAPWAPYFPIDFDVLPKDACSALEMATQPIVFSRFAQRVATEAGVDTRYVPLCVDTSIFRPQDRRDARERLGWSRDRFIAGLVADNKDNTDRKAFVEQLVAFAQFSVDRPDSLLYLHTNSGADGRGLDLVDLCASLGLVEGRNVVWVDQYLKVLGVPESHMVDVFNGLDVLLGASAYEGFGVPLIEAQACGTPVITGDWTSMGELGAAGWLIARDDTAPQFQPLRGLIRRPQVGAIVDALEQAYRHSTGDRREAARVAALPYDADRVVTEYWAPVLYELAQRSAAEQRIQSELLSPQPERVIAGLR